MLTRIQETTQRLNRRRNYWNGNTRRPRIRLQFHGEIQATSCRDVQTHHLNSWKWRHSVYQRRVSETWTFPNRHINPRWFTNIDIIEYRNAGFFIYMDLSPYLPSPEEISNTNEREFALAKKFLDAGVFIHPGEEHGKLPGWFRLVYSHEEEVLQEGLRR